MAGYKAHFKVGLLTASTTLYITTISQNTFGWFDGILLFTSTVFGSLLPDIDHPKSFLGRRLSFLSRFLYKSIGHRTLTHSLIFISTLSVLLVKVGSLSLALGLLLGMLSHILLDLFSFGDGVAFLYPFYTKRIRFRTRNKKFKR